MHPRFSILFRAHSLQCGLWFQQNFSQHFGQMGRLNTTGELEVPCYPLHSLLLAMNISKVDFFSLDVEGDEYPILHSIPFDKVDISVLAVEVKHGNYTREDVNNLMIKRGYVVDKNITFTDETRILYVEDMIYVNENLKL